MNTERIAKIAAIAGVSPQVAREWIEYDWPEGDEHTAWLASASDEEIASWIAAGQE